MEGSKTEGGWVGTGLGKGRWREREWLGTGLGRKMGGDGAGEGRWRGARRAD